MVLPSRKTSVVESIITADNYDNRSGFRVPGSGFRVSGSGMQVPSLEVKPGNPQPATRNSERSEPPQPQYAFPPQSITITLKDEIDISRGDMLVHPNNLPRIGRRFEAMLIWMDESPMDPTTQFIIKHTTHSTKARIDDIRYLVDVNTLRKIETVVPGHGFRVNPSNPQPATRNL
jgi:translation elongation factor EF-1alpha